MPIDKNTDMHYQAGRQAFKDGVDLANKPGQFLLDDWEIGWHDAHAELTRSLAAQKPTK